MRAPTEEFTLMFAKILRTTLPAFAVAGALSFGATGVATAAEVDTIRVDWAYYNPVSLVLKEQGLLEQAFAEDGIEIEWVQSLGSNKALELLNSSSVDFGSTAGAAALLGKINGNPIKSVYVYSKPEWTALVTRTDTGIARLEDLKGKSIAVTRGTDPYIFLLRSLASVGLSEKDVNVVLLQHGDGKNALINGDGDAWSGLDPYMAQSELESGATLFFRNPDLNTYGFLNVREEFAAEHPELVERVLAVYEAGRKWAQEHPAELQAYLVGAAKITDAVAARQLGERTDLNEGAIGARHLEAITAAGTVLQQSGVIEADVDVAATANALIDPQYIERVQKKLAGL
jgi:sulfonate transport system substrate-binding protein